MKRPAKDTPRALHPRVRVHCKACGHIARRYFDKIKGPCTNCGSTRVHVRPNCNPDSETYRGDNGAD